MDKTNIVSSQNLYSKCPPLAWTHAQCLPRHWSIVSSKIDCSRLHQTSMSRRFNSSTLWICLNRHNAAWHPRSRNPQDWDLGCLEATGWMQGSLAFLDTAVQLLHVCGMVCRCTVLLEHKVVARHSVYRWQHYDVIMTSWSSTKEVSKRYPQNFFLLCNNNEITACIADLFNSFCEEVYAVAFFKVVQQQTVGEVGKSIVFMGR